jgi:hypothetical protein
MGSSIGGSLLGRNIQHGPDHSHGKLDSQASLAFDEAAFDGALGTCFETGEVTLLESSRARTMVMSWAVGHRGEGS